MECFKEHLIVRIFTVKGMLKTLDSKYSQLNASKTEISVFWSIQNKYVSNVNVKCENPSQRNYVKL